MMRFGTALKAAGLTASLLVLGTAANAALVSAPLDCELGGVTLSPAAFDSCEGAFLGNDSQLDFQNEINGLFNTTGTWSEWAKAEEENSWVDGTLKILTGAGDATGTFEVIGLPSSAVFVIKAAGCFSAYYFTGIGSPATGTFDTEAAGLTAGKGGDCPADGNVPGISHLTIYTGGEPPSVIPLPAAGWLLLAGVGGLAAMRRKKAA
jgi:hypothetical protein